MKVLFVRHGVSEDGAWMIRHGKSDFERPLTPEGSIEISKVAAGLLMVAPDVSYIVASPLVRAQETATLIARAYNLPDVHTEDALSHEYAPSDTLASLARIHGAETILCVGHQPNISATISFAVTGSSKPIIDMGRGASCGVYFPAGIRPGAGSVFFHAPRKIFQRF